MQWILSLCLTGYSQRSRTSFVNTCIKEFGILTIKDGNRLKHENEAEGHGPSALVSCLSLFPHLFVKIQIIFYALLTKDVLRL